MPVTHDSAANPQPLGPDDLALIAGLLQDDRASWDEFFVRYDRLIFRCITRVTGRFASIVSHEDVREIYANVIVNLLHRDKHKLRTFDPARGSKLGSWVGLIAINTAYDYLRGLSRQPGAEGLAEVGDRPAPAEGPFEQTLARERLDHIARALGDLSERDRLFVSLYYVQEREPEEVAEIMGISVKTVYTRKHKLRTRLNERLDPATLGPLVS